MRLDRREAFAVFKYSMRPIAIGDAVRRWRAVRGLSQRALAERAAIGYVIIARLELGQTDPRLSTLEKLAKALNVTVAELIREGRPARKRAGRR